MMISRHPIVATTDTACRSGFPRMKISMLMLAISCTNRPASRVVDPLQNPVCMAQDHEHYDAVIKMLASQDFMQTWVAMTDEEFAACIAILELEDIHKTFLIPVSLDVTREMLENARSYTRRKLELEPATSPIAN